MRRALTRSNINKNQEGYGFLIILFVVTLVIGVLVVGQMVLRSSEDNTERANSLPDSFENKPKIDGN